MDRADQIVKRVRLNLLGKEVHTVGDIIQLKPLPDGDTPGVELP